MPILTPGRDQIAYTLEGQSGAPVLMFSNSLGTTQDMWRPQAEALAGRFRVLRYDTRGHGGSGAATSNCTLAQLGNDALRLLDSLDIERVHFCGISMGGLIGQWLGVHAGHRLRRLIVANSAARIGTAQGWRERHAQVTASGMDAVADGAAARWFSKDFNERAPQLVRPLVQALRRCAPAGYAACCLALAEADLRGDIGAIGVPTLLIAGRHDSVTTIDDAQHMAASIAQARTALLDASHLSNIEAPDDFTGQLRAFLD